MNRDIISLMQTNFHRVHGMYNQFIDICPDNIWQLRFGGWPVWQQICHNFASYEYFVIDAGDTPMQKLVSPTISGLREVGQTGPSKVDVKHMGTQVKDTVDRYIETLTDRMLTEKHEGCTKRFGMPMTHISVLTMLPAHAFYHLGTCDGALREQGLKGVF